MRSPLQILALPAMLALAASLANCGGPQTTASPPSTGTAVASAPTPVQAPAATSNAGAPAPVSISKSTFGKVDGKEVNLYVLTNAKGLFMKVTNYGAIVTEFHVPDRTGKFDDIVGGYDNLDGYLKKTPYFGATIGRVANRITNGRFQLEGKQPGVMFYTGLFLDGTITGKGHVYKQYEAFCIETQKFPNSINVPAWRNEVILKPGQKYKHVMIHRFSTD